MKNPNGYGCVYHLSGKRRKTFGVRITVGYDDSGKQLYKPIGYFTKREEAMIALAEYNKNPHDLNAGKITFADMYKKWSAKKYTKKISDGNIKGYKAAYKRSESLHDMIFADIRKDHMQDIIDECDKGHSTLSKLKVLYGQLYNYALEHDIVKQNYSQFVDIGEDDSESTRVPFTQDEIQLLWDNVNLEDVDTVLIMVYTGMRPGELITIKTATIDIEKRIMRGGIKTKAGKNRIIPINKKIVQMVKNRLAEGGEYLIQEDGQAIKYNNYYTKKWLPLMARLQLNHTPHECRHTFATLMDNAGANKLSIKRIMGHASADVTDGTYTHKDLKELIKAIDLI